MFSTSINSTYRNTKSKINNLISDDLMIIQ